MASDSSTTPSSCPTPKLKGTWREPATFASWIASAGVRPRGPAHDCCDRSEEEVDDIKRPGTGGCYKNGEIRMLLLGRKVNPIPRTHIFAFLYYKRVYRKLFVE